MQKESHVNRVPCMNSCSTLKGRGTVAVVDVIGCVKCKAVLVFPWGRFATRPVLSEYALAWKPRIRVTVNHSFRTEPFGVGNVRGLLVLSACRKQVVELFVSACLQIQWLKVRST